MSSRTGRLIEQLAASTQKEDRAGFPPVLVC